MRNSWFIPKPNKELHDVTVRGKRKVLALSSEQGKSSLSKNHTSENLSMLFLEKETKNYL